MNEPFIQIAGLHKRFGKQEVLRGVDIAFEEGKISVIIGKSGTGKSVLIKHVIGILRPDAGYIRYKGRNTHELKDLELIEMRKDFGYLFQDAALFDSLTVAENIAFPLEEFLRWNDRKKISARVAELLSWVELPGIEHKYPSELSGGMRKRVGLARALAVQPKTVLFDEPTTGLDPVLAQSIDELIVKVNRELGITCIVISHDIAAAFRIAYRIAFLYDGKIEFYGTPEEATHSKHPVLRQFIDNAFEKRNHTGTT